MRSKSEFGILNSNLVSWHRKPERHAIQRRGGVAKSWNSMHGKQHVTMAAVRYVRIPGCLFVCPWAGWRRRTSFDDTTIPIWQVVVWVLTRRVSVLQRVCTLGLKNSLSNTGTVLQALWESFVEISVCRVGHAGQVDDILESQPQMFRKNALRLRMVCRKVDSYLWQVEVHGGTCQRRVFATATMSLFVRASWGLFLLIRDIIVADRGCFHRPLCLPHSFVVHPRFCSDRYIQHCEPRQRCSVTGSDFFLSYSFWSLLGPRCRGRQRHCRWDLFAKTSRATRPFFLTYKWTFRLQPKALNAKPARPRKANVQAKKTKIKAQKATKAYNERFRVDPCGGTR